MNIIPPGRRVPLTYPLPPSQWFRTPDGWASRPWTPETRAIAERALTKRPPATILAS